MFGMYMKKAPIHIYFISDAVDLLNATANYEQENCPTEGKTIKNGTAASGCVAGVEPFSTKSKSTERDWIWTGQYKRKFYPEKNQL